MKRLFCGLAALLVAAAPGATATLDPLRQAITDAAMPATLGPDGAHGPGWDALLAASRDAGVVMVGEQHGVGDIVRFAAALQAALAARGFGHAAYEIGPLGAEDAERLIRTGGGAFEKAAARRSNRFVFPFVQMKEDAALVRQIVEGAAPGQFWGLDQEFIGSAPLLADRLETLAATPEQKAAVATFRARAAADWALLGSTPETIFDDLRTAFAGTGGAAILDTMILSNRIYAPFTGRGGTVHDANTRREALLKMNFVRAYDAAEATAGKPPRVFMKFGANHAMRGFSPTDVPALGNFIAEWGLAHDVSMLNILVDCAGGEMWALDAAVPCEAVAAPGSALSDAAAHAGTRGAITVIDLKPLRARVKRSSAIDAESRRLLFAFDFYVAIRDPKAATPLE